MIPLGDFFARQVPLATLPTPLHRCAPFSGTQGVEVDLKRDDLMGDWLTGTKMRALSFILAKAVEDGVTDLITIGEPTSNQCRLVAMLGARHEMTTHILLRKSKCFDEADSNLTIMRMHGADLQFLGEDEWRLHGMAVKRLMSRVRKAKGKALFIPFGCGGLPGVRGIVGLFDELTAQHDGRLPYSHVLVPTGSGSTLFGLHLAAQLRDAPEQGPKFVGVSVARAQADLVAHVDSLFAKTNRAWGTSYARTNRLSVADRWREMSPAAVIEQLQRVARTYGFMADPVYVLPAVLELERMIHSGELDAESRVLLLVSGACRTLQATHRQVTEIRHADS